MQGRSRQLYSSRHRMLTFPDEIKRLQLRILKSLSYAFNGTTGNSCRTQMREPISSIALEEAFLQDKDQFVAIDDTLRISNEALIFRQLLVSQGTTEALKKRVGATDDIHMSIARLEGLKWDGTGMSTSIPFSLFTGDEVAGRDVSKEGERGF